MSVLLRNIGFLAVMIVTVFYSYEVSGANADSLARNLSYQFWSFPQEKVYLSTDRAGYVAGDTIRFRAFLVDALSHRKPSNQSKFVYVDLIDPFGNKTETIKIKETEGMFAGMIPLDPEMAEGSYTINAYTQFMENSGKDYFFRKSVPVFSNLSAKYRLETEYKAGILHTRLYDKRTGNPVRCEYISVQGTDGKYHVSNVRKRSSYPVHITNDMRKDGSVKLKYDKYEKIVPIPSDSTDLSITFHPEGGYLIPNQVNKLAFKAINSKGMGVDFRGVLMDETGQQIKEIYSTHKGMGTIEFEPKYGVAYHVDTEGGTFTLPAVSDKASVLNVEFNDDDSIKISVSGAFRPDLSLIVNNGGIITLAEDLAVPEIECVRSKLGAGIVQLLLVDAKGDILSSRLIFNHDGYIFGDDTGVIPSGDYSVKAIRRENVDAQSSIVSDFLLQSELKGYIEDPDYYFREKSDEARENIDLLMLTHGWERYDIASAIKGDFAEPMVPLEIGGEISGVVKSRWKSKPLENAVVMLISPQLDFASQTFTDSEGRYAFNGFDWPEGTDFLIQVFGKSGSKEHNFSIDSYEPSEPEPLHSVDMSGDVEEMIDEKLLTAGTVLLEELVVTAPLSLEESRREMLSALGVRSFTADEMEKQRVTSYEQVFQKIPGLRILDGNLISSFGRASTYNTGVRGAQVELWIDGVRWTPFATSSGKLAGAKDQIPEGSMTSEHTYRESLFGSFTEFSSIYPFHIVESIEYYRPSTAMIISLSATQNGGALVVTTKQGSKLKEWDADLFIKTVSPLGYQDKPEVYKPHFVYDATSDEGKYIAAWLPRVAGMEEVPVQEDCVIEIEGLTDDFIPLVVRTGVSQSSAED